MAEISKFERHLFEYRHDGSMWLLDIAAKSPEDARERLKAISWATYKGVVVAKIPVPGGRFLDRMWRRLQGRLPALSRRP